MKWLNFEIFDAHVRIKIEKQYYGDKKQEKVVLFRIDRKLETSEYITLPVQPINAFRRDIRMFTTPVFFALKFPLLMAYTKCDYEFSYI